MKKYIFVCFCIISIYFLSKISTLGIDISHHNNIHWEKLNPNIHFCYIKATEGRKFIDPKVEINTKNAINKDLYIGYYHYFRTNISGKEQFNNFQRVLTQYNSGMIPVLDVEDKNNNYNSDGISNLKEFLNCFYQHYHYYPIIYYGSTNAFFKTYKITYKCKWWLRNVPWSTTQWTYNNLDYNYTLNLNTLVKQKNDSNNR